MFGAETRAVTMLVFKHLTQRTFVDLFVIIIFTLLMKPLGILQWSFRNYSRQLYQEAGSSSRKYRHPYKGRASTTQICPLRLIQRLKICGIVGSDLNGPVVHPSLKNDEMGYVNQYGLSRKVFFRAPHTLFPNDFCSTSSMEYRTV